MLVRYNPDGDQEMNKRQADRLKELSEWLHENDRKFLFELLVPAEDSQLEQVDGDTDRYDAELRPELMRRTITELQDHGVEADIWKIEGIDTAEDCKKIAETCRRDGRDGVICVVLGRGADDEKVDHWLRQGAGVEGYAGLCHRANDLVGRAQGVPRQRDPARRRRRADRRQLPALREGLQRGRQGGRSRLIGAGTGPGSDA